MQKISTWHKYIFTHRPPAAHNSTLIRLEDEAFSLKRSNSDLHKCREVLLWIFLQAAQAFPAQLHTPSKQKQISIHWQLPYFRDIKKNGAGIVYNMDSSGDLNTESTTRTRKSAEVLPGLHLPKAHSTRTILEDQKHKSQLVTWKPPKNNYPFSPLYVWRTHDFRKVFISP